MRTHLEVFLSSFFEPSTYIVAATRSRFFLIRHLFLSLILITILHTIGFARIQYPYLLMLSDQLQGAIKDLSTDTVYTLKDGVLSRNPGTLPETISLYTSKNITLSKADMQVKTYDQSEPILLSYKGLEDGALNGAQIKELVGSIQKTLEENRIVLGLGYASVTLLTQAFTSIFIIGFFSLFVQTVAWVRGIRFSYRFSFRIGLCIYPVAASIDALSYLLFPNVYFPLTQIVYIIIALFLFSSIKALPTAGNK